MRKLHPITALYLKILEFISFLLIEVGGKIDDRMHPKNLTSEKTQKLISSRRRMRRIMRSWGDWY